MTFPEALQEARLRWGADGYAWKSQRRCSYPYKVGLVPGRPTDIKVLGRGISWEYAFDDAKDK